MSADAGEFEVEQFYVITTNNWLSARLGCSSFPRLAELASRTDQLLRRTRNFVKP